MLHPSRSYLPAALLLAIVMAACGGKPAGPVAPSAGVAPTESRRPQPPANPTLPALDSYPEDVQRLARLGKLWGAVRYLHPYLFYKDLDWDAAGVSAIAAVSSASNDAAYHAAVREMLAAVGDPATTLVLSDEMEGAEDRTLAHSWMENDVLVIDMGTASSMDSVNAAGGLIPEIGKARAVIVDLRGVGANSWVDWIFATIAPAIVAQPTEMPADRGIVHSGYQPQQGSTSGGYYTAFTTAAAVEVAPTPGDKPARVVFLLGDSLALPGVAAGMQAAGQAIIVAPQAVIGTEALGQIVVVDMGGDALAVVRTTEPTFEGALMSVVADATVTDGDPFATALAMTSDTSTRAPAPASGPLPPARWRPDETYSDQALPSRELRILAAFRLWTVIDRFYPYLHLIGDWDRVLPLAISELAAASTAEDYARAVVRVAAYIADSHTHVRGGKVSEVFGGASAVGAAIIEGKAVVIGPSDEASEKGVAVGDVIETVDGVTVAEAMSAMRPYVAGSTDVVLDDRALYAVMRGQQGSSVELGLRGPQGSKTVILTRTKATWTPPDPNGVPYRVLESGFGYVDLRELLPAQVAAMFELLKDTPAIIFDMRGYPNGTAWSIAPRLDRSGTPTVGATFQRCIVSALDNTDVSRSRFLFEQNIPESDDWKYEGRTYMLINHDTISQAEHTGLFFEAANGTEFIGTNTSGANGDVTNTCLPGGICVGFTGHDVRHADGRQLQRVGLEPHLRVEPTIAGIRAGTDEVLDAAIEYAKQRGAAPTDQY